MFVDIEGASIVPAGPAMQEKPTLMLVHGGPGFDHSGFKPIFSQLADVAQIVYLDVRGCGRTDRSSKEQWRLQEWADDLHELCLNLEIQKPVVFGLSFGGYVALQFAIRYPHYPSGIILSSTTAQLRIDRALQRFEELGGPDARQAAQQFWDRPCSETFEAYARTCLPLYNLVPASADAMSRAIWNLDLMFYYFTPGNEGRTFNLLPHLRTIDCSTLIIAGEEDPITTREDAIDMASALRPSNVQLEVLANCRHGAHRDQPEKFFALVRQFLTQKCSA